MFILKLRNLAVLFAVFGMLGTGLALALSPLTEKDAEAKAREIKAVDDTDKGKSDPASVPLEARLINQKESYTLDPDLKKKLEAANAKPPGAPLGLDNSPPGSAVDLVLEVKNTGDKELEVWKAGTPVTVLFKLDGPGAVSRTVNRPIPAIFMLPVAVKLAPGKGFSIPIKILDNNRQAHYFTAAGEYTLTATLATAVLPAPKDAKISEQGAIEEGANKPIPVTPGGAVPPEAAPVPAPGGADPGVVPGGQAGGAAAPMPIGGPGKAKKGFGLVTLTTPLLKIKVEAPK
jgi:hypothetical protein